MDLVIEITRRCNMDCVYCFAEKNGRSDIDISFVSSFIDEVRKHEKIDSITLTGGEPLLHKQFREILECAARYCNHILLLTNGTLLFQNNNLIELLKKIDVEVHISLDSVHSNYHDIFRGHQKQIINAVHQLVKEDIKTVVVTVVSRENISEIPYIEKFVSKFGISNDYELLSTPSDQRYSLDNITKEETNCLLKLLLPWSKKKNNKVKYRLIAAILQGKNVSIRKCYVCKHNLILCTDGTLQSCFFNNKYVYSNLSEFDSVKMALEEMTMIGDIDCFDKRCMGIYI